jgi:hypothetical protein
VTKRVLMGWLAFVCVAGLITNEVRADAPALSIGTFQVDATPPIGSPLCNAAVSPASEIVDPLSARGIVILGSGRPIVLCAVDWVGIANGGYDAWRAALAEAAGTSPDRVAVHTLHQHDAPGCDFEAEKILEEHGIGGTMFPVKFTRETIARAAAACKEALKHASPVTHVGFGRGKVEKVGATRRPLGPDGKVKFVRWSGGNNAQVRAEPEGLFDPYVALVSFWNNDRPLAVMTYYAVHPMTFYGHGAVSADFAGVARSLREAALPGVAHIHFDGAGGDVTAGKYNGGTPADRRTLGERLAAGMQQAWETSQKTPITPVDVTWRTTAAALPLNPNLQSEATLLHMIDSKKTRMVYRVRAAIDLAWVRRAEAGHKIEMSCLKLGPAWILHIPGELSVEYQLAAQKMRPHDFVAMAAYGDYGSGYICMAAHYSQGGYEPTASRVGPAVQSVLFAAMKELLK